MTVEKLDSMSKAIDEARNAIESLTAISVLVEKKARSRRDKTDYRPAEYKAAETLLDLATQAIRDACDLVGELHDREADAIGM